MWLDGATRGRSHRPPRGDSGDPPLSASDLKRAKREVRREVLAVRDAIDPGERSRSSLAIARRLMTLDELSRAHTVMIYWSFGSEVDTEPSIELLIGSGKRVALPRISEGELEVRVWRAGDSTTPTSFGVLEHGG